ncbi:probable sarcosine oxidase [Coffea eugenioides]|uniref:probable sarcosine oxidase n=1 Tax=Coffea eugenioides TaxID=49369 RepID=UPI000F61048F|nr:probable sarcosine oxidase [Coffea eugenioides]
MENCTEIFDVIVVGAGVMGSSTAYQTAKRGKKTLLLEQFDFLHHRGSSHGESRTIRATYTKDFYPKMVLESAKLWEEAEEEAGYKVYFKTSQIDLGSSYDKSLQAIISSCQKNRVPVQVLNHNQVSEEFSGKFQLTEDWIGVVIEHGGVIRPTKAVSMFQMLAMKNGASLRDNMEVVDIKKDPSKDAILVSTRNGQMFWAKKCVVTVGAWMKKLVKEVAGLTLPIQPQEITVYYWKIEQGHEAEFTIESGFPTFSSYGEAHIFGTPSLEFPALLKILVDGGHPCDPDKRTWSASPDTLSATKEWIQSKFGGLVDSSEPVLTQSCMYSMTPDKDYVIDYLDGEFGKDVVVAGGFSGHGFKMAPIIGRILADLAIDMQAKDVDMKHFNIKRFEGNSEGNHEDFDD